MLTGFGRLGKPPGEEKAPVLADRGLRVECLAVPYFRMGVHTIIGAKRFHFRGRDGVGWFPLALATRQNLGLELASRSGCRSSTLENVHGAQNATPTPFGRYMVKPRGQLVLVSFSRRRPSTPSLSTWWSSRALRGTRGPREVSSWEGLPA